MARVEIMREGAWALVACSDTDPAWVAWVHDSAPVWLAEVVRIAREGRAAGIEAGATPALWAAQTRYTQALVTAIGALCAALNTPVPSFGPWATRVLAADVGPDPWPGWGDTSPGEWRFQALETVARRNMDVREAFVGEGASESDVLRVLADSSWSGNVVFDQYAWRVWLRLNGEVDARYLAGLPPTQLGDHTEDYHENNCNPTAATGPTAWSCLGWSVWNPPPLAADRSVWFNVIGPLGPLWRLAASCADELAALGSADRVLAEARGYQNTKNNQALNYLVQRGIDVSQPEDLLNVVARDQAARLQIPQSAIITRQLGSQIASQVAGPVGIVILVATQIPEILYSIFGQAYGRWNNLWGEREPAVARASLSGVIDLRHPRAPVHAVPVPPPGATAVIPAAPGGSPVLTFIPVTEVVRASRETPRGAKKKSSGGAGLALGVLLVAALTK